MARRKPFDLPEDDPEAMPFGATEDNPLPPLDEFGGDDMAGALNDQRRERLDAFEPAPIGAGPASSSGGLHYGEDAGQVVGRPASPRIWANAQLHSSVTQLRVWKKINGVPTLIGAIDKDASEEEFVREFFDLMPRTGEGSGVFIVRPIDREGREIREEITLPPISEHHSILRQMRVSRAAAATAGMPFGPSYHAPAPLMDPALLKLVERAQESADARMRLMEEEMKMARDASLRVQEQAATERMDLASRTAMSVEAITERMMKQEGDRNTRMIEMERDRADKSTAAMSSVFGQMQMMMAASADREREAFERRLREDESRRDRDQHEHARRSADAEREGEAKRTRERDEYERKAERERQDGERREREREAERTRQHDQRMKEMDVQAQRDREHAERMIELARMREHGESIEGTVEKVGKVLAIVGLKPADVIEKFMGGAKGDGEEAGGMAGTLSALAPLLGEGVKVIGEVMKAGVQARAAAARGGMPPMLPPPGYAPPGYAPQGYPPPGYPPQGYPPPAYAPPALPGPVGPDLGVPQGPAPVLPAATLAAAEVPPGPTSTMPLGEQRNARNALRALVKTLRTSARETWEQTITMAIVTELAIYHYVRDVGVRPAILEAGADAPLADQIMVALKTANLPADIRLE
jgi:hypothetical protein